MVATCVSLTSLVAIQRRSILPCVCSCSECPQGLLVSGSGDSTVPLWDFSSGVLLDTCEVAAKAGLLESNGEAEEHGHAVTYLCTTISGLLIAVAIQSLQGTVWFSCDVSAPTLSVSKVRNMITHFLNDTHLHDCCHI
ncbi:uncharacterized protein [Arachis hypogaea]|uniref:uncharacterized protein isoform X2 n=1 Tax=Arachis hypogaea TaxID=3818 RepID=UPI003B223272